MGKMGNFEKSASGLLLPSVSYKPFRYPWAYDFWQKQQYMENYMPLFKPVEVRMMLAAFSNMETIHIAAYALLLETIGMPDSEFSIAKV